MHMTRLYDFLSQVNHAIVRSSDEQSLMDQICSLPGARPVQKSCPSSRSKTATTIRCGCVPGRKPGVARLAQPNLVVRSSDPTRRRCAH